MDRDIRQQQAAMITEQLKARGITSPAVLQAMAATPRHLFVPAHLQASAYEDRALPIECEQTISQPYMVALMTQALELTGQERVLEIGTGSGYQTAVLSQLVREVYSMERHAELAAAAATKLQKLGCHNVHCRVGDGSRGWPEAAPFDRILIAAAAAHTPDALLDQLADPGRLIVPIGGGQQQELTMFVKHNGRQWSEAICPCRFVPLVEQP